MDPAGQPLPRSRLLVFFAIALLGCGADLLTKEATFRWLGIQFVEGFREANTPKREPEPEASSGPKSPSLQEEVGAAAKDSKAEPKTTEPVAAVAAPKSPGVATPGPLPVLTAATGLRPSLAKALNGIHANGNGYHKNGHANGDGPQMRSQQFAQFLQQRAQQQNVQFPDLNRDGIDDRFQQDPRSLAQMTSRMEQQQPGLLGQLERIRLGRLVGQGQHQLLVRTGSRRLFVGCRLGRRLRSGIRPVGGWNPGHLAAERGPKRIRANRDEIDPPVALDCHLHGAAGDAAEQLFAEFTSEAGCLYLEVDPAPDGVTFPPAPGRSVPLAPWLLPAAMLLFLAELVVRRLRGDAAPA